MRPSICRRFFGATTPDSPLPVVFRGSIAMNIAMSREARRAPDDDERLGGEDLVLVDGHDVGMPRHRPERAERAVGLIVHGASLRRRS